MGQAGGGGASAGAPGDSGASSEAEATSPSGPEGGVLDGSAGFGGDADAGEYEADAGPDEADAPPDEADAGPDEADAPPDEADAGPDEADAPPDEVDAGPDEADAPSDEGVPDTEAEVDTGPACPEAQESCGGLCFDLSSDSLHCGACNIECPAQQSCKQGSCQCPSGFTWCLDSCVDVLYNSNHCGACGLHCATECTNGVCKPTCGDAIKNSLETDVDCGGTDCPGCSKGKACTIDQDCACGTCEAGICGACLTLVFKPGGSTWSSTGWNYSVAVADLNVDGVADIVASNPYSGLDINLSYGNSYWGHNESAWPHPTHHALYDMNLDGKLDVVGAIASPDGFSVHWGNGFIDFDYHVTTPLSVASRAVAAGLFDDGEVPDVVVAHTVNDTVSVWYGAGDGTFSSGPVLGAGAGPVHVIAPDLNADGRTDVVSADSGSGAVSVWFSESSGFAPRAEIATGEGPAWVAAGDLDADGKLDLAVVNQLDATVSILLNSGAAFSQAPTLMTGGDPRAVAIDDFDLDGKLDLVVVGWPDRAMVFRGTGLGTFEAPMLVTCTGGPQSVATGDVNGDGLPDIVVGGSAKIQVLANWSY